jgi:thioredoxin-like negative regulator of GroEL
MPPWVAVLMVFIAAAFIFGIARSGPSFKAGIEYERGQKALEAGNAKTAVDQLSKVEKQFPENKEVRMNLIRAYLAANDPENAARILNTFEGEHVEEKEGQELNDLEFQIGQKLPPDEKAGQGGSQ